MYVMLLNVSMTLQTEILSIGTSDFFSNKNFSQVTEFIAHDVRVYSYVIVLLVSKAEIMSRRPLILFLPGLK